MRREVEMLELERRREWELKEILLEGVLESELARGEREGMLRDVDARVREAMERDVLPSKSLEWSAGVPAFRSQLLEERPLVPLETLKDIAMRDAAADAEAGEATAKTPQGNERSPSPPPTGHSGGFDGDADPYDNYLAGRMAEYEERERLRSLQNTPLTARKEKEAEGLEQGVREKEKEAEAVGALVGMSGVET